MAWRLQGTEDKLRARIAFLEDQARAMHRQLIQVSELLRENAELRRRQHWLETENNRLSAIARAIEKIGHKAETA